MTGNKFKDSKPLFLSNRKGAADSSLTTLPDLSGNLIPYVLQGTLFQD